MKKIQIEGFTADEFFSKVNHMIDNALENKNSPSNKKEVTLLTKAQTAKFFSISLRSLHNWNQSGILKPYTISNRVYYRSDEIEEALVLKQY